MRDTGEYLLSSAEEEITWRDERKCHRINLMAEEARAMRSVMKVEAQRKRRKVFRRGTRIINIGIVFPNLHGHILLFFSLFLSNSFFNTLLRQSRENLKPSLV